MQDGENVSHESRPPTQVRKIRFKAPYGTEPVVAQSTLTVDTLAQREDSVTFTPMFSRRHNALRKSIIVLRSPSQFGSEEVVVQQSREIIASPIQPKGCMVFSPTKRRVRSEKRYVLDVVRSPPLLGSERVVPQKDFTLISSSRKSNAMKFAPRVDKNTTFRKRNGVQEARIVRLAPPLGTDRVVAQANLVVGPSSQVPPVHFNPTPTKYHRSSRQVLGSYSQPASHDHEPVVAQRSIEIEGPPDVYNAARIMSFTPTPTRKGRSSRQVLGSYSQPASHDHEPVVAQRSIEIEGPPNVQDSTRSKSFTPTPTRKGRSSRQVLATHSVSTPQNQESITIQRSIVVEASVSASQEEAVSFTPQARSEYNSSHVELERTNTPLSEPDEHVDCDPTSDTSILRQRRDEMEVQLQAQLIEIQAKLERLDSEEVKLVQRLEEEKEENQIEEDVSLSGSNNKKCAASLNVAEALMASRVSEAAFLAAAGRAAAASDALAVAQDAAVQRQEQRKRCAVYKVDTSAAVFGQCVCGKPKSDHSEAALKHKKQTAPHPVRLYLIHGLDVLCLLPH